MRLLLVLITLIPSVQIHAEPFFPLPELSDGCSIEVGDYDDKVKEEVQKYVSMLSIDFIRSLIWIRRATINEGSYTIQKETDSKIFGALNMLMTSAEIPESEKKLLESLREELKTYPLAIPESDLRTLEEQFLSLGI